MGDSTDLRSDPSPPKRVGGHDWNQWQYAALAGFAVYIVFLYLWLHGEGYGIFALIRPGIAFTDPESTPIRLPVTEMQNKIGYDGQFFYRLSNRPFDTGERVAGVKFDEPPYRHARILYPLLAWLAAGGGKAWVVPYAMVGVNLVAAAALSGAVGAIARRLGRHAMWGVVAAANPGLGIALVHNTAEIVCCALLAAMLLALICRRGVLAAALGVLALATRDTAVLAAVGLIAAAAFASGADRRRLAYVGGAMLAFFVAWTGLFRFVVYPGVHPVSGDNLAYPFQSLAPFAWRVLRPDMPFERMALLELVVLVLAATALFSAWRRDFWRNGAGTIVVVQWALLVCLSDSVWLIGRSHQRVGAEMVTVAIVAMLLAGSRRRLIVLAWTSSAVMLSELVHFNHW